MITLLTYSLIPFEYIYFDGINENTIQLLLNIIRVHRYRQSVKILVYIYNRIKDEEAVVQQRRNRINNLNLNPMRINILDWIQFK